MKKIALVRNSTRFNSYQGLADNAAAIEPPIWMMLKEQILKSQGREVFVIDNEVECDDFHDVIDRLQFAKVDEVQIYPTGNHPSAYFQQRDGLNAFVDHLKQVFSEVNINYTLDFDPTDVETNWGSFNLSQYKAHNWHCDYGAIDRKPYGVIFTSISCPFKCNFCGIHSFYGDKYKERSLYYVMADIMKLVHQGVRTIKVMDELFFYRQGRVECLCDNIISEDLDLNLWAYARIDTINPQVLTKLRKAGFRWLGLGIESGNEGIRRESLKGSFNNAKIREVVKMVKDHDIKVGGNFIFGFPNETSETMQETLDFAMELKCEFTNLYSMMAYPDTELAHLAKINGWELPKSWSGYSQYSHDCHPIRTHHLTSSEVLKFRDHAFDTLYTDAGYLSYLEKIFGEIAIKSIKELTAIKLKRKLLNVS